MTRRFESFYKMFGNRGIMFIIFAFSVIVNTLLSLKMHIIAISPDEYGTAGVSAFLAGLDWSGTMSSTGYYCGFVQSTVYAPLFKLFANPYALYKAMLVVNGIAVSLVPTLAFDLARRVGVKQVWQKLAISVCCGFYAAYIAHSKFIWSETAACVLPWVIIWLLFVTADTERPVAKSLLSWLCAFFTVLLYFSDQRLIGVVIAIVLTVVVSIFVMKRKLVYPLSFCTGLVVMGLILYYAEFLLRQNVWLGTESGNLIASGLDRIDIIFTLQGFADFCSTVFGHLFYFVSSTWGVGALALVAFSVMVCRGLYRHIKKKSPLYNPELVVFGVYAFFSVGSMMSISVLSLFNSVTLNGAKDTVIFGRFMDSVIPLAIMFALCWLFIQEFSISQVFSALSLTLTVDAGFFMLAYPIIANADIYRISPILSIMSARFGESFTLPPTFTSFVIISSSVSIAVIAALIIVSCARRWRAQLTSAVFTALFVYSTVFTAVTYLPLRAEESLSGAQTAIAVSELVYNDPSSPPIVTYRLKISNYTLIQFLNPQTTVRAATKKAEISENCILIADAATEFEFKNELKLIGTYKNIAVYARGEKTEAYIISKTLPQD